MSNGFQLYIGVDGSQILFDASTGKRYMLMEEDFPIGNPNNFSQQQNYGNHQNVNMSQLQHRNHAEPQDNRIYPPNLMIISPNEIHTPQPNTIQQNTHAHIPSQFEYQQENTSTPTQQRKERTTTFVTEPRGIEQNANINNNKRSLNESDEFITVMSKNQRKKNQKVDVNQQTPTQQMDNNRTTASAINKKIQNNYNVPIEQLQRAVAHNLPCFTINFLDHENLPSAVVAAEELYEHFNRQEIKLNQEFSVVRYYGNQLKVGVKDKSDYQTLCDQKIWPKEIDNKQISIYLPKFVPEQFSLVVHYIPTELSINQVEKEVKRSASTANNFRKIVYSYPRKTTDYRFTVADLREYNGLLRLGHIGIGNRMRIVTPYRPANKITYCSKCWKLGHLRNQCQEQTQKCRVSLLDYNETHNQVCSKQPKCAQCSLDHFSLDADCQSIQQYRSNLNKAVKQAVEDGAIKLTPSGTAHQAALPPPKRNNTHYPPLPAAATATTTYTTPVWNTNRTSIAGQHMADMTNHQLLEQFKIFMDGKINQVDAQLKMVRKETNENKQAVEEVQVKLNNVIAITKTMIEDIIKPIINSVPNVSESTIQTVESLVFILKNQYENTQSTDYTTTNNPGDKGEMNQDQIQVQL